MSAVAGTLLAIHAPKMGGSWFTAVCRELGLADWQTVVDAHPDAHSHSTYAQLSKLHHLPSVAMVRHPLPFYVSHFLHMGPDLDYIGQWFDKHFYGYEWAEYSGGVRLDTPRPREVRHAFELWLGAVLKGTRDVNLLGGRPGGERFTFTGPLWSNVIRHWYEGVEAIVHLERAYEDLPWLPLVSHPGGMARARFVTGVGTVTGVVRLGERVERPFATVTREAFPPANVSERWHGCLADWYTPELVRAVQEADGPMMARLGYR